LLEIATSNTERLIILVNDILDMEKISSGKDNFAYQDVSCNRLILNTMNNIRPIAEKKQITMIWDEQAADTMVRVDPVRAGQVLLNLLSNGIKFTPRGGRVTVSAAVEPGGQAVIRVRDTGIGIDSVGHVAHPKARVATRIAIGGRTTPVLLKEQFEALFCRP
jgi:signal transduction histidine kinase